MQFKALLKTLAITLVAAFAVIGSAAAATSPRPKANPTSSAAKHLSPAERIAIQEDARRNDLRIYGTPATIDGRSPDTQDAAQAAQQQSLAPVDGRSPDTIDVAIQVHDPVYATNHLSPAQRIAIQEDARRNDPRIYGTSTADSATRAVVEVVAPGGFHWADAGVGAGAAFALLLLGLGMTLLVRNRPLSAT